MKSKIKLIVALICLILAWMVLTLLDSNTYEFKQTDPSKASQSQEYDI